MPFSRHDSLACDTKPDSGIQLLDGVNHIPWWAPLIPASFNQAMQYQLIARALAARVCGGYGLYV